MRSAQQFGFAVTYVWTPCRCGHDKVSHRPHGGRRVPLSGWVCRKRGCTCEEFDQAGPATFERVTYVPEAENAHNG